MGTEQDKRSARCRAFLRTVLLFGLPVICGAAALANGAAKGDTAAAFPYGAQLTELYHGLRLRAGSDTIGSVYVTDDRMMRYHHSYDTEKVQQVVTEVNDFAREQSVPVYWMAVPTAAGIYAENLPPNAPQANEQAMLQTVSEQLDGTVTRIEVYSWLYAMRDAYIYYRTDARWTSYGAFCAYKTAVRKMGFANMGYDRFRITHLTASYQGSFAQETGYFRIAPDVVDLYECEDGARCTSITVYDAYGESRQTDSLYDTALCDDDERLEQEAYRVFPAADAPMIQVETDLRNGKHLLMLTDDYGACMVPFFTQHYAAVTVINTRLAEDFVWRSAQELQPDQILIVCSADTIAEGQWLNGT